MLIICSSSEKDKLRSTLESIDTLSFELTVTSVGTEMEQSAIYLLTSLIGLHED